MKNFLTVMIIALLLVGCKNESGEKGNNATSISTKDTITTKIAKAYGFDDFEEVTELNFTFNVKVNDTLTSSRSWKWFPKDNRIELTENGETSGYSKDGELDEEAKTLDQKFINDTYWLLFPFQLVWSDYEQEYDSNEVAPVSKEPMPRLTIKYTGDGGYTPGDSYHLYLEDDNKIKEWTYQSSGGRTLSTTWEDHETFNGITIAKKHKTEDGNFQLYFTDIKVIK